jgi:hypothetical protein
MGCLGGAGLVVRQLGVVVPPVLDRGIDFAEGLRRGPDHHLRGIVELGRIGGREPGQRAQLLPLGVVRGERRAHLLEATLVLVVGGEIPGVFVQQVVGGLAVARQAALDLVHLRGVLGQQVAELLAALLPERQRDLVLRRERRHQVVGVARGVVRQPRKPVGDIPGWFSVDLP